MSRVLGPSQGGDRAPNEQQQQEAREQVPKPLAPSVSADADADAAADGAGGAAAAAEDSRSSSSSGRSRESGKAKVQRDDRCWRVLHVRAQQEKVLAKEMGVMSIEHFLPLNHEVRRAGRKKVQVQ